MGGMGALALFLLNFITFYIYRELTSGAYNHPYAPKVLAATQIAPILEIIFLCR